METTRPFLFVDLQKSWREEQHPRDTFGKFSTIRGGSRVVTKTGKTGVVQEAGTTHHKVRYDDGKLGKVAKESVLHEKDYQKVEAAKKAAKRKAKTNKAKAAKTKATKEANKVNATGKTGAGKALVEPTAKPAKAKSKTGAAAEKKRAMAAPVLKRETAHDESSKTKEVKQAIPSKKVDAAAGAKNEQNRALAEAKNLESDLPKAANTQLGDQWQSPAVQKIMAKAPEKRSSADIAKVAGELTTANDKLARHVVNKMAAARGINPSSNIIGNKATRSENVIRQDTGLYGDMLQSARATMFETLSAVMSGSQKPGEGTAITAHVIQRIKQKLHRDLYDMLNDMPAPHRVRGVIGEARKAEASLQQELGRAPSHEELADHLQKTSKAFRETTVAPLPKWDEKNKAWVAEKKGVTDPAEKLRTLQLYANQQKASSIDKNVGDPGEREATIADGMSDRTKASVEDQFESKERQQELEDALPKAMQEMGLSDDEISVLSTMYSQPSETGSKANLTAEETAARLKEQGKDVTGKWVANRQAAAFRKIGQAREANHPAIQELMKYLTKSLFVNGLMRAIFEFELVKGLMAWGVDPTVLEKSYTHSVYADSTDDLRKSLLPHQYIGSYVTMEDGEVIARIIEFKLPDNNSLYKSFNEFNNGLKKSMFAHMDSQGRNHVVNQKATDYVKANAGKYKALASTQQASARAKKGGSLTWSEELLVKNPGTCWITWGGKKILIHGETGEIKYDSSNEAHREEHNQGAQADKIEYHHETEAGVNAENAHEHDHGIGAFRQQVEEMRDDWKENKPKHKAKVRHKLHKAYEHMSEEERAKSDALPEEDRAQHIGEYILGQSPEAKAALEKVFGEIKDTTAGMKEREAKAKAKDIMTAHMDELKEHGKPISNALVHGAKMGVLAGEMTKMSDFSEVHEALGRKELERGGDLFDQKMVPEGTWMIANPITGKTMVVKVEHGWNDGGKNSKTGFTSTIAEAFDPDGRNHEDLHSWGGLGKALGFKGEDALQLQQRIASKANTDSTMPFLKPISEEEYLKHRASTKLGMQEGMLHKEFKLVNQSRDKDGNLTGQTFAQKMPDGTLNHISVDKEGYIKDPLMKRLLNQRDPVTNAEEMNALLKKGVGNRRWVTAHFGSGVHIGDALGHHIELEYDGKGAPRVVSGPYKDYRYIDSADIPKGSIDPATGEPVKALFHGGKLIDRKFSTQNEIPMKEGNAVLYPNGSGGFRKGRIRQIQGDTYKITDGKGHVIGMYKKSELKPATEEGRMLSNSGQVAVKLSQTGVHRMNVDDAFAGAKPKARELFEEALRKAKINTHAFDGDGKLLSDLELSDPDMKKLQKVLGRSKAGKAMLKMFTSNHTPALEIHVPEAQRSVVEQTGVRVGADGTAKISASKFEELRNALGGLSIHHSAQDYLNDHFKRKDREQKPAEQLRKEYQPALIDTGRKDGFDEHYKAQFNPNSYLMKPDEGLYKTQLEGASHLVERKRGIAGHGMGTGKTILGVVAALHYKADKLAKGEQPKKTLIVAPKGIMSDWGKEIGSHTNSKGLFIGSGFKGSKVVDGKKVWGQAGTEQEATSFKDFKNGAHKDGDHDFHIVSYDTFMNNRDHFTGSGLYDNIAIDEVHAFKNKTGKRGTALSEATNKFENVWGLSGTPMENDAREVWSLVDTVTGGRHELGSRQEFQTKFMQKDRSGKITGVKESAKEQLGDILANVIQFRGGEDVEYNDGSKIPFPHLAGAEGSPDVPNPKMDFVGNMVDRSRDHNTNAYYGTKHSVSDFDASEVKASRNGEDYSVQAFTPKNLSPSHARMYETYKQLQAKYLPESKLQELAAAAATGYDQGKKGKSNYMTAMQKLQKFLNAPLAHKMYAPGGNAVESTETDAQGESSAKSGLKPYDPKTGEGHYVVDKRGMKRYFESDGQGGFNRDSQGNPIQLPPLHHDNPKAQYLQQRINTYLDSLRDENTQRVARGEKPIVPKLVVKSSYTTFGTDIVDNVLKDVRETHPIFKDLHKQGYGDLGQGRFTGDADDREDTKVGFRGNKNDYMGNQGNLWATTVSPAGKEGVDFGNAHVMFHYDQEWNPQKMAQFTARVRRSDSWKTHKQTGRANSVRVESLHMPGTVEDFMFASQDAKIADVEKVVGQTKQAEKVPKLGETQGGVGYGARGFTSKKRKVAATPSDARTAPRQPELPKKPSSLPKLPLASADKALKLVILL